MIEDGMLKMALDYETKTFEHKDFVGIVLGPGYHNIDFYNCTFNDCIFVNSAIRLCNFNHCTFIGCEMCNITLIDTRLSYCSFFCPKTKRTPILFKDINLEHYKFHYCRFNCPIVRGTTLTNCNFLYCDCNNSQMENLKSVKCTFINCDTSESYLDYVTIDHCDYVDSDGRDSSFYQNTIDTVKIINSNFNHTMLYQTDIINILAQYSLFYDSDFSGNDMSGLTYDHCGGLDEKCPKTGTFIGYKRTKDAIVTLRIPGEAKRSSVASDKCRCSKAAVLAIEDINTGKPLPTTLSTFDNNFIYQVGETVKIDNFDQNRWNTCAPGIHFFMTKQEAKNYVL